MQLMQENSAQLMQESSATTHAEELSTAHAEELMQLSTRGQLMQLMQLSTRDQLMQLMQESSCISAQGVSSCSSCRRAHAAQHKRSIRLDELVHSSSSQTLLSKKAITWAVEVRFCDLKAYIKLTDGVTISIKDSSPNSHFSLTKIQSQRLDVS